MMNKLQLTVLTTLLSLLLVTFTQSAVVPDAVRVRRSSADQRIAELQALLALSGGNSRSRTIVAHGMYDPDVIGKKKRSGSDSVSEERYQLLRSLIARAALESSEPSS